MKKEKIPVVGESVVNELLNGNLRTEDLVQDPEEVKRVKLALSTFRELEVKLKDRIDYI
jgi:hypothetical protein